MVRKPYWELLRDPRWQRRRLEVMGRARFACETCGSEDKTLNVHHKLYRKGAMPWEYPDAELQCLCEECHENEHEWKSAIDTVLARLDAGTLEFILGYAEGHLALSLTAEEQDIARISVKSYEHAEGMLAAIWQCHRPGDRPNPDCLIDHRELNNALVQALGDGVMPNPPEK